MELLAGTSSALEGRHISSGSWREGEAFSFIPAANMLGNSGLLAFPP